MKNAVKLPKALKDLIRVYADNDMNRAATARAYGVTSAAIWYRLDKVEDMTGLDPRRFYDLAVLVRGIEGENTNLFRE